MYTTIANVRNETNFNDSSLVADATITNAITAASDIIDGYVVTAYTMPLTAGGVTSTPNVITHIATVLAGALLYQPAYGEESKATDKGWKIKWDYCMAILANIQTMKQKLLDPTSRAELDRSTLLNPSFFPTAASSDPDAPDSTRPKMTMNKRY